MLRTLIRCKYTSRIMKKIGSYRACSIPHSHIQLVSKKAGQDEILERWERKMSRAVYRGTIVETR